MNDTNLTDFSSAANSLEAGAIYRHYKGLDYKIIGVARHSETLEELVVYQALYGTFDFWVRPVFMFLETVEINGASFPRFEKVTVR